MDGRGSFCGRTAPALSAAAVERRRALPAPLVSCRPCLDPGPLLQLIDSIHNHDLAGRQALLDDRIIALYRAGCDGPHLHRPVVLHYVDEAGIRAVLHGGGRRDYGPAACIEEQAGVDELVREEGAVLVGELSLEARGAGAGVDGIVDRQQLPGGDAPLEIAVPGLDGEILAGVPPFHDLGEVILRHVEENGDRLKLRDGRHAVGIGGMHDVARIDQAKADAAVELGYDAAVDQLQLDILDGAFVGLDDAFVRFDGALGLTNGGGLGIGLLAGNDTLGCQFVVAALVGAGVFKRGLVAGELPLRLGQLAFRLNELRLIRARVDFGQQVAFMNELALLERYADQFAVHAGADRDRVISRYRTQAGKINAEVAAAHRRGNDGNGTHSLLGWSRRRRRALLGAGRMRGLPIITIGGRAGRREQQNPDPTVALARPRGWSGRMRSCVGRLGSRSKIGSHRGLVYHRLIG